MSEKVVTSQGTATPQMKGVEKSQSTYCVLPKMEMGGNIGTCMQERF